MLMAPSPAWLQGEPCALFGRTPTTTKGDHCLGCSVTVSRTVTLLSLLIYITPHLSGSCPQLYMRGSQGPRSQTQLVDWHGTVSKEGTHTSGQAARKAVGVTSP